MQKVILTLEEAIEAMGQGKKVRNTKWGKCYWLEIRTEKKIVDQNGNDARLQGYVMSGEWEVLE